MRTAKPNTINVWITSTKTFCPAKLNSVDAIKNFTLLKNDGVVARNNVTRSNATQKNNFAIKQHYHRGR